MTEADVEIDIVGDCDVQTSFSSPAFYESVDLYSGTVDLSPYFAPSSWASEEQVWSLDSNLEVKNRPVNEKRIQCESEEQVVSSNVTVITSSARQRPHGETYRKPWSEVEKEAFKTGVELYGRSWSNISKHIRTRTTLQVKNYACQLLKQQNTKQRLTNHDDGEEQLEPDFNSSPPKRPQVKFEPEEIVRLDKEVECSDHEDVDIEDLHEHGRNTDEADTAVECSYQDDDNCEITDKEKNLELHYIAVPLEQLSLDRTVITDEERTVHREFFEGRQQKTPERYLKIRNYILDRWESCRPGYLKKTSVRTGLKNCGDVNCIGRIHTYLEQIGAINFGCEQTVYVRPLAFNVRLGGSGKERNAPATETIWRADTTRKRKRKLPDEIWDSSGGYTIHHDGDGDVVNVVRVLDPQTKKLPRSKCNRRDPFRLIPCREFTPQYPAPFSLVVQAQALVVVDVHAHSSSLEVIGLLGGRYDVHEGILSVTAAEPCESSSTGLECEMDPVSQTQASESLQHRGFQVVGWYHSHPTFAPNPSLRDLETQDKFQGWFGKGGAPFIGVIVSPFLATEDPRCARPSKIQYLMTGDCGEPGTSHKQPYRFDATVTYDGHNFDLALCLISQLIQRRACESSNITYLEKTLQSSSRIMSSAKMDPETCTDILSRLRRILDRPRESDSPGNSMVEFCADTSPWDDLGLFKLEDAAEHRPE